MPPARKIPVSTGPLQLLDRHGKLFYQSDGKKTLTFGYDEQTTDFVQYALQQLARDVHVEPAKLLTMGLRVTTTLDLDLQNNAYTNAQQQIAKVKNTKNINDCAIVVLDYHYGSIRALIGSLNARQNTGYNAATQNVRQLGSIYKPFVYATAFDQGISPGDVVNDVKTTFPTPQGDYTPINYDGQFHGLMSYRTALQNEYNIPAIKLLTQTKIAPTIAKVAALGLPSPPASQFFYPLALGVTEATVLNATVAYGTMANQGVHVVPNAIENVTDTNGHVLYHAKIQGMRALSPAAAFMITDVLSDDAARATSVGICSPMVLYTTSQAQCQTGNPGTVRPAAAMLGTTDSFRDNWTLGYTSDYAVGVWSGNDDFAPMVNTLGVDGAAPIWHDTMLLAEGNAPIQQFPGPPNNVIKKTITDQGLTTTDWHLK
jgi:membrane peptidoglycan carboxypeptidase